MDWTLVALSQMGLITLGVSVALGLRIRGIAKQNAELREHAEVVNEAIAELESTKNPSPKEWVAEQVEALDPENQHTPIIKLVLEHSAKKNKKFNDEIIEAAAACGLTAGGESDAGGSATDAQSEDLKKLLQQFTQDSREMMACIQALEKENAELREQLGLPPEKPVESKPEATVSDTVDQTESENAGESDSASESQATTETEAEAEPASESEETPMLEDETSAEVSDNDSEVGNEESDVATDTSAESESGLDPELEDVLGEMEGALDGGSDDKGEAEDADASKTKQSAA
ncbi:MAG: hypothetical protein AAF541_19495 [Pseudomonadota bacterium]